MRVLKTPLTHHPWLKLALLIFLTVVAYAPSLSNGFIWDDDGYVQANPNLHDVQGLVRIWTVRGATPQYYPLVHSTFWVEHHLWGLWAPGYHATNLLLHITGALLWWLVLMRLGLKHIAYLGALIFALHPINVETVCWITERKNVLSLVCYLLAALCYLNFAESNKPHRIDVGSRAAQRIPGWGWYILSLLCFTGALLSKTVTCTFPAAMVLAIWVRQCHVTDRFKTVLKKLPWKHVILLIPFFVIGITLARITISMETHEVGASGMAWSQTMPERIIIYSRVVLFYFHKVIYPDVFMFNYPRWHIDGSQPLQYCFPLLVLLILFVFWHQRQRLTLWPLAGLLFAIGTLLPASGLFDVYPMRFSFVADHFAYHAVMGYIAIAAGGIVWFSQRLRLLTRNVFLIAILLLIKVQTLRYAPVFDNWFTLFTDTLRKNPESWMACNYRGVAYEKLYDQTGNPEYLNRAYADFQHGLKLHRQFAQLFANDGSALIKLGKSDKAIPQLERAVKLQPDLPQGHYWLGLALEQTGQLTQAVTHYQQAVDLFPGYVSAWHHMAWLEHQLGHDHLAIKAYRQAITLRPQSPAAYQELGLLLLHAGDYADALPNFQKVAALRPGQPAVLWSLGLTQYMLGNTGKAVDLLQQSLAVAPNDALKLDMAWILTTCPEAIWRNIPIARRMIQGLPDSAKKKRVEAAIATPPAQGKRQLLTQAISK